MKRQERSGPASRRITSLEQARAFYRTFHDKEPEMVRIPRPDWYAGDAALVVLGRAGDLSYEPFNSAKDRVRYVHEWGDAGERQTGKRPWVVTDGERVYLMEIEGDYFVSPERGIVG